MTLFQKESCYFPLLLLEGSLFHTKVDLKVLVGWEYK